MRPIPVTILTGFLGAGKTTLLNRLIDEPEFGNTAVIVNEFGEAGVDGSLVAKSDERAFAMTTGCLCCTVSGDVRATLLRLREEAQSGVGPSFDRVVIETTGLADPVPLLQTLMSTGQMQDKYALNGVVTLVDAINGPDALDRFPEAGRQIAVADQIFVTKTDLAGDTASAGDLDTFRAGLRRQAPNADIQDVEAATAKKVFSLSVFDPDGKSPEVGTWLSFSHDHHHQHDHGHNHDHHHDHDHHHHDANTHGDTATAFCFGATTPIRSRALKRATEALQNALGSDLLRLKGLVNIAGSPNTPRVVHLVGHAKDSMRYLEEWPQEIRNTRLVLIVSGNDRSAAAASFQKALPELYAFNQEREPLSA